MTARRDVWLSGPADRASRELLETSFSNFGTIGRERYASLLARAIDDIAEDPGRPGVRIIELDRIELRLYHIRYSRHRVPDPPGRVVKPRHVLVFTVGAATQIEVHAILHDAMVPEPHLRRVIRPPQSR